MTRDIMEEQDSSDRKLSIPKICHEPDTAFSKMSENKLLQRRRLLNADTHDGTTLHNRSCSFRDRARPKFLNVDIDRARRSSLPSPSANLLSVSFNNTDGRKREETQPIKRVRSFKTTSKGGIVNRGDSFKRSSNSVNSTGSAVGSETCGNIHGRSESRQRINSTQSKDSGTAESTGSSSVPIVYNVAILGDKGVGKTALANQFMTSEYVAFETEQDDEDTERHVTILLNSEESTLEFTDKLMDNKQLSEKCFDAFVVVYSITDRSSFQAAVDQLYIIRHELFITDRPTLLIANKIDLVRKRKVSKEEGRSVAKQYECKYTETSAALNHHVDELLVGILSQIRLKITPGIQLEPPVFDSPPKHDKSCNTKLSGPKKLLSKIFKRNNYKTSTHECENLFTS